MPACVGVQVEKIRATINLNGVVIKTPYVKAFNVDETRGGLGKTFSTTIEIRAGVSFTFGGANIIISAGIKDQEKKIITGIVKSMNVQPSYDKAGYYILSMSGVDALAH